MSEVSVIGLGVMGSELGRVLLRNDYLVTVWNRTATKAEPLIKDGALLAPNAAVAVEASPVVLVCVDDYKVSHSILETEEVAPFLSGKVLVELSTGTPQDARDAEGWARERGVDYLDGAIMATPSQVGRPDTTILVSGARSVFEKSDAILKTLAGNLTYTGGPVGNASALDLALLSYWFGGVLGFLHGARTCESEGFPADSFGATVGALAPVVGEQNKKMGEDIRVEKYDNPESSIRICAAGMELIARHAREAGINSEFPDFACGIFKKAVAAGHGDEGVAAVIKVLREGD